jgi:hypothetical protein
LRENLKKDWGIMDGKKFKMTLILKEWTLTNFIIKAILLLK